MAMVVGAGNVIIVGSFGTLLKIALAEVAEVLVAANAIFVVESNI